MTASTYEDRWRERAAALRVVHTDVALLHELVVEEIGHPLPPDMVDFVRDWLDVAMRVAERKAAGG